MNQNSFPAKKTKPKSLELSEGHKNILFAKLIDDVFIKGGVASDCFPIIIDYYTNTVKSIKPSLSKLYKLQQEARALWLTNIELPNLENYRKEQLLKADLLEKEIKTKSKKDIVDKAKATVDVFRYKDNLVGLNNNQGSTDVYIGISTSPGKIIDALDFEEAEVVASPKDKN